MYLKYIICNIFYYKIYIINIIYIRLYILKNIYLQEIPGINKPYFGILETFLSFTTFIEKTQ